jgi:hypothetical protein
MTDVELMTTLSIFQIIEPIFRNRVKNNDLPEKLIEKAREKIELTKEIEWTDENLVLFIAFLQRNTQTCKKSFHQSTVDEILKMALDRKDELNFLDVCKITKNTIHIPSHHAVFYKRSIELFQKQKGKSYLDFSLYTNRDFLDIIGGLFINKDAKTGKLVKLSYTEFPAKPLEVLMNEILSRIRSKQFTLHNIVGCLINLNCLKDLPDDRVYNTFASKIIEFIDIDRNHIETEGSSVRSSILIKMARYFYSKHPLAKEIYRQVTYKYFITHVLVPSRYFLNLNDRKKLGICKSYLDASKEFAIFQVVFLDMTVKLLTDIFELKENNISFSYVSEIMSILAELNYPARFNTVMPHKETQWETWSALINRSQELILEHLFDENSSGESSDSEVEEESLIAEKNYTTNIINYLWSMCVFDNYSRNLLQNILNPMLFTDTDDLTHETYGRLFQIHYWLEHEYSGEFKLPPELLQKMMAYKSEVDYNHKIQGTTSELKTAIRDTLKAENYNFKENFSDFPYVLDFANFTSGKNAVLVDTDSSFIEGSNNIVRPGFQKVAIRQIGHLGWTMKRFNLKSWIKSGHMPIFPK